MIFVGVDDGIVPNPKAGGRTVLATVFLNEKLQPTRARLSSVTIDGNDATLRALELLQPLKNAKTARVLLDGVTYAGFNYIDPHQLAGGLGGVGVIVFFRWLPQSPRVWRALREHFSDALERWRVIGRVIEKAHPLLLRGHLVHAYSPNLGREEVVETLERATLWGAQPEPLRLAHLVAREASRLLAGYSPPSLRR